MNVFSLFDGISCGHLALEKAGIPVDIYLSSEIDKQAILVTQTNYPDTIQVGDVQELHYRDGILYANDNPVFQGKIDIVMGGSPCSWWSNARQNRSDIERTPIGQGYTLFCHFTRLLKEVEPKWFLYENNYSISQEVKQQITEDLGVPFIMINSALVSAQNRKRCYWTNIPDISQPQDRQIFIADVIPQALQGAALRNQKQKDGSLKAMTNIRKDKKSNCLIAFMANKNCCVQMEDGEIRPLTAEEYEVLQTLPVGYTACLSESARKKVIGLGWNVETLAHIFRNIPKGDNQ